MPCDSISKYNSDGGAVQNTRNGIIVPDLELAFAIPENPVFAYSEETGELTVYTADGQEIGAVQAPKNEGKTVFPVVVKDKDGNLYKIEDESPGEDESAAAPTTTGEGTKLTATYLGKQTEPLPKLDNTNIAANTAVVTFEKGGGKFAFDQWKEDYGSVSIIAEKKVYDRLANSANPEGRYDVPWKLLPEGESDAVQAKIEIRDKNFDPEKVIFSTPQGTNYEYTYDSKNKTYTLHIAAGADGDVQEIYALNRLSGQNYRTLGKLNVITCRKQTPKVILVSVNGYAADAGAVKRELDRIYLPAGVSWEVAVDTFNHIADRDYFEKGSGLLTAYNEKMTALQKAYAQAKGLDKNVCYIFVLNHSGENNNRNTAGFMPRGKQFGYIFLSNIGRNEAGNVIAHELGHGLWKLRHTFDEAYGKTAEATQGTTDNLMDYNNGAHLAKWQWDVMSEPAIFDGVLDRDEDGMVAASIRPNEATTRRIIEEFRYHYAFNKKISYDREFITTSFNIVLFSSDKKIKSLRVNVSQPVKLYPHSQKYDEYIRVPYKGVQYAVLGAVPAPTSLDPNNRIFEVIVHPDDLERIKSYLLVDSQTWYNLLKSQLESNDVDLSIKVLAALPDEAIEKILPKDRLNIIAKIAKNGLFNEPDAEWAIVRLFSLAPENQQASLLDNLVDKRTDPDGSPHLLAMLTKDAKGLDGELFAQFVSIISGWVGKYKPCNECSLDWALLNWKLIPFKRGFWAGNAQREWFDNNGQVRLTSRSKITGYETPVSSEPFSWIWVNFLDDFNYSGTQFYEGTKLKMPAYFAYALFNEENKKRLIRGGKLVLDVGLFAVGIGEIKAAATVTTQTGKWILTSKAILDMGIGVSDIIIQDALAEKLSRTEDGRIFLENWTYFQLAWGATSMGVDVVAGLKGMKASYVKTKSSYNAAEQKEFDEILDKAAAKAKEKYPDLTGEIDEIKLSDYAGYAGHRTDQLFPEYLRNGARINEDIINEAYRHIDDITLDNVGRPTYTRSGGLSGCHNEVNFRKQLSINGGRIEIIDEVSTSVNGFKHFRYRVLQLDATGKVQKGIYYRNGEIYTKTIFDPKIWTETKLKDIGYKGFKDAMNSNSFYPLDGRTFKGIIGEQTIVGHYKEINGEKVISTWWLE